MRTEIKYTATFRKRYQKADKTIQALFFEALELFLADPHHPSLRNHPLKREYAGYRSINVTEDWRALFKKTQSGKRSVITFHMIGTHKQLYG